MQSNTKYLILNISLLNIHKHKNLLLDDYHVKTNQWSADQAHPLGGNNVTSTATTIHAHPTRLTATHH